MPARKTHQKYIFRRVALLLLGVFLLLFAGWWIGRNTQAELPESPLPEASPESPESSQELPPSSTSPESLTSPASHVVSVYEASAPENEDWMLLLVNETHPLPESFTVDLEKVSGSYYVDARIAKPVLQMIAHAKADGINLELIAAHTSAQVQQDLLDAQVQRLIDGGMEREQAVLEAKKQLENPGNQEYTTGLAVGLLAPGYTTDQTDFETSAAYTWLGDHAREYGFILRYPKDKTEITDMPFLPWQYRFVGVETAAEIWENGYCLEEYLYLKDRTSSKPPEELFSSEDPENAQSSDQPEESESTA